MARVFLSYDHEDSARAALIASALERAGHSVWWDRHIRGGSQYSREIEEAVEKADAVVVLWSESSVQSPWVRDEAAAGRELGKLVPVSLDSAKPPMGFRQYQTIDLAGWKGGRRVPNLDQLEHAIGGSAAAPAEAAAAVPQARNTPPARMGSASLWRFGLAAAAVAVIVAALLLWRPWERSSVPTVAVAPADSSAGANAMARDLLVKLGSLQEAKPESVKLVEGTDGVQASLILTVGAAASEMQSDVSLALLDGSDRTVLWSKAFQQPIDKEADLKQQLSFTAAKVLECALEALDQGGRRLNQQTLKLYLNGCAAYSELTGTTPRILLPTFREVTEKAPWFEGGWAKLLSVESELVDRVPAVKRDFKRHIAAARKLNPDMAEAYLAEARLLHPQALARRIALVERAAERNPDSTAALVSLSLYSSRVGLMREAVELARRAVQLDPLAPSVRHSLMSALTYAGQFEAAEAELNKAEQLWPGASNLRAARYRFHLRYGDPREALQVYRSSAFSDRGHELFLLARIDPSGEAVDRLLAQMRSRFEHFPGSISNMAQAMGEFDREEELIPILLNWSHPDKIDAVLDVLFRPALRELHHDPRMIAVAARIGLVDYWRESDRWPDFCSEPGLPYDCQVEAAKLASPTSP